MTLEQTRLVSAEDFWALSRQPEYTDKSLELVEGVVIEVSRPNREHGKLAARLAALLIPFVDEHDLGEVTVESGYILFRTPDHRDTVRGPDVAFVATQHLEDDAGPFTPVAPDLAVEIVSPNDTMAEIDAKVDDYLRAGTKMVWVLFPRSKSIFVHTPSGTTAVDIHGTLDGGEAMPGFKLAVKKIFEK